MLDRFRGFPDLRRDNVVAEGGDSKVYRYGDFALKWYFSLPLDEVEKYQRITQRAGDILNDETVQIPVSGVGIDLRWYVEPIIEVREITDRLGNKSSLAISRYIPGDTLSDVMRGIHRSHDLDVLATPGVDTQLNEALDSTSSLLNSRLRTRGINLVSWNVKPIAQDPRNFHLIITDIGAAIDGM